MPASSWTETLRRGRFMPLLASLLLLFALYPVLVSLERTALFRFGLALTILVGVFSLASQRRRLAVAAAIGVPAIVAQAAVYATENRTAALVTIALTIFFLVFAAVAILRSVLRASDVTSDTIAGAICVYLLLGLIWAMLYGAVELTSPGAYRGIDLEGGTSAVEGTFLYFSFVTLTTLGYGDISPIAPAAQSLTWLEAVTGQLYLAVLVARLVALRIAGGLGPGKDG